MNFWGFTPWLFAQGEEALAAFLRAPGDEMKKEYPLPLLVDTLMHEKGLRVEVLSTAAVWFGVTNPQDKAQVMAELRKLHDAGRLSPGPGLSGRPPTIHLFPQALPKGQG